MPVTLEITSKGITEGATKAWILGATADATEGVQNVPQNLPQNMP